MTSARGKSTREVKSEMTAGYPGLVQKMTQIKQQVKSSSK